jgi:hypothetical protein
MERGFSPPKSERTEALPFFSEEEVARARSYHRPLYWVGAADVVIESFDELQRTARAANRPAFTPGKAKRVHMGADRPGYPRRPMVGL